MALCFLEEGEKHSYAYYLIYMSFCVGYESDSIESCGIEEKVKFSRKNSNRKKKERRIFIQIESNKE